MAKQKNRRKNTTLEKLILATATIKLLDTLVEFIQRFLE